MPITCAGRFVRAAISVIEIELVLVARMASASAIRSSCSKIANLTAGFSLAASMTSDASAAASSVGGGRDARQDLRRRVGRRCVPFLTWRSRLLAIVRDRLLERGRRGVDQRHVPPVLREDVRDPVAHRARADDRGTAHIASFRVQRAATSDRRGDGDGAEQSAFGAEGAAGEPGGSAHRIVDVGDVERQAAHRSPERGECRIPAEVRRRTRSTFRRACRRRARAKCPPARCCRWRARSHRDCRDEPG